MKVIKSHYYSFGSFKTRLEKLIFKFVFVDTQILLKARLDSSFITKFLENSRMLYVSLSIKFPLKRPRNLILAPVAPVLRKLVDAIMEYRSQPSDNVMIAIRRGLLEREWVYGQSQVVHLVQTALACWLTHNEISN